MRNILIGIVAGLVLGWIGALAYSHYVSESQLDDLQAQLATAHASLAKAEQSRKDLANESSSLATQVDQLQKSNEALKHPAETEAPSLVAKTPPPMDMGALAGVMRGAIRGGFQNPQQRMLLLQTRLKLTSEQSAQIKAAMDADTKARADLMRQMWTNGGKMEPAAAAKANTLDTTLASVLNPEQQRQYAQLQTDEKAARADTSTTAQINSMAPLLQLSESQRQQVYDALYQVQMAAPDPTSLIGNPNAVATMTAQAQATNVALAKVLTPEQLALYQQQNQSFAPVGQGFRGGYSNAPGGPGNTIINLAPAKGTDTANVPPTLLQSAPGAGFGGQGSNVSPVQGNLVPLGVVNPGAPAQTGGTVAPNPAPANLSPTTNAAPQLQN